MNNLEIIIKFLVAYRNWALADAPEHPVFTRESALCGNLSYYCEKVLEVGHDTAEDIIEALNKMFSADELCEVTPFNGGTMPTYNHEFMAKSFHRNPKRLEWINKTIVKGA